MENPNSTVGDGRSQAERGRFVQVEIWETRTESLTLSVPSQRRPADARRDLPERDYRGIRPSSIDDLIGNNMSSIPYSRLRGTKKSHS
jgi:hypothetical protein